MRTVNVLQTDDGMVEIPDHVMKVAQNLNAHVKLKHQGLRDGRTRGSRFLNAWAHDKAKEALPEIAARLAVEDPCNLRKPWGMK